MLNKELFLASEDKIWGKITLTSVFPLTREQVEATRFAHKISDSELLSWWTELNKKPKDMTDEELLKLYRKLAGDDSKI